MSERETWQDMAEGLRKGLLQTGRDVWLASLGAVATVGDEAKKGFDVLVERGKSFEAKADTTRIERAVKDAGDQIRQLGHRVEGGIQETSRAMLHRFGVPSHAELQALITRVEQLSAKIDALSRKEVADVQET